MTQNAEPSTYRSAEHHLLGAALACLLKAGRFDEAKALATPTPRGADAESLLPLRAAALAQAGDEEGAYRLLTNKRPADTLNPMAHALLLSLSKRRVATAISRGDLAAASEGLTHALKIAPTDPGLQCMARTIRDAIPVARLREGKHGGAIASWEEQWRDSPSDTSIWHNLALAYYFAARQYFRAGTSETRTKALGLKASERGARLAQFWRNSLTYWGSLYASDDFWLEFVRTRAAACRIEEKDLQDLATELQELSLEAMRSELREQVQLARKEQEQALALQIEGLLVELEVEVRAARFLRRALSETPDIPAMGPRGLEGLKLLAKARALISASRLQDASSELLLGGTGRVLVALDEKLTAWAWEEALQQVRSNRPNRRAAGPQDRDLPMVIATLAVACDRHASELSSQGLYDQALDILAEGHSCKAFDVQAQPGIPVADLPVAVTRIAEEAVRGYIRRAARMEASSANPILEAAVKTLRKAVTLNRSASPQLAHILTVLSDNVREIGLLQFNEDAASAKQKKPLPPLFEKAIELAREAWKVAPDYTNASKTLSHHLSFKGVHEWNCDRQDAGITIMKEALKVDPNNVHASRNLGGMLKSKSIDTWNAQNEYDSSKKLCRRSMEIMLEAIRTCPTESDILSKGIELLQGAEFLSATPEYAKLRSELMKYFNL